MFTHTLHLHLGPSQVLIYSLNFRKYGRLFHIFGFLALLFNELQMFSAFLYAKKFSRDGHLKYLFLSLDRSIIAFLNSLVINLAWFPLSFFILKEHACLRLFEKLM